MKIKTENLFHFHYTVEDIEALERTEEILSQLYRYMHSNDEIEIVSTSTGEVISMSEIPRVRGIVNGLLSSRVWDFSEGE